MLNKGAMTRRINNINPDVVADYAAYWRTLTPTTPEQKLDRWIFSFCSAKTQWQQNVAAYNAVKTIAWNSLNDLIEILEACGCGCFQAKAEGIWNFYQIYNSPARKRILGHPLEVGWTRTEGNGNRAIKVPRWQDWRDALVALAGTDRKRFLHQAGPKLVSFAQEMCWPTRVGVVAVDTHVAQWYGTTTGKMTKDLYKEIEDHWLTACARNGYPPDMVRHILWDQEHGEKDTRYWAHVFEEPEAVCQT